MPNNKYRKLICEANPIKSNKLSVFVLFISNRLEEGNYKKLFSSDMFIKCIPEGAVP